MTQHEREQLRISLLRYLSANLTRFGLPIGFLQTQARMEGRPSITSGDVEGELVYLEDKQLVDIPLKAVSPECRNWRITAAGRDYLAALGVD